MPNLKDDLAALRIDQSARAGNSRRGLWITVVVLLIAVATAGWVWSSASRPPPVKTASVTARDAAPGQLRARCSTPRATSPPAARPPSRRRSPARWSRCCVEEGMAVKKGQVLARLDDSHAAQRRSRWPRRSSSRRARRAAETEVRLRAGEAQARAPRRSCVKQQVVSTGRRSTRRSADVDVADGAARSRAASRSRSPSARSRCARQDLDDTVIRAPFAGVAISQGRAAGRDDLAGLGRRRLHPHRHLHDRRHDVARDRGRRQRELHQPRAGRPAGRGDARRLSRLADSRRTSSPPCRRPTGRRRR